MYQRTLERTIRKASEHFPVLLITGPRQVGKTTLLEMCAEKERGYVTLDDMNARRLAQSDPALFIQSYPPPVIIDEIQYAPELFSAIKMVVDREKKDGLYWLTGSQKFHLMRGISESLAGRVAIFDLLGLSQSEKEKIEDPLPFLPTEEWRAKAKKKGKKNETIHDVYERIWRGGFPKVQETDTESRDVFYRSYIQTYIQRDVKDLLDVTDSISFSVFLTAVAARTGQLLSYADIARDAGISPNTAKSWISILETSGLIYILRPYFNNLTKRLIKAPKIYFLDTGLCAYLTKWTSPASLEAGSLSGAILETYAFSEILKSYWHNGKEAHVYYYRDADQKEIDLLIEANNILYPIEFKKTASPSPKDVRHFHVLKKLEKNIGQGGVLCLTEHDIPISREATAFPIRYL